ncbi:glycosyltransferase family 4 protein [Noviherbaspirillum aridicola]|uniref:Glycosyl transferase n=1 Tax=Noviherbaspirillum aridicola TaxID=2849687 RepID=A0ABQ4Q2I7_9BURK|nr:glycosyltransferase family 4 protein [Noviherbaspirillum aridicola]GIZ51313.1 glycosyl transferase [Noviherbaspirillum aridicola]
MKRRTIIFCCNSLWGLLNFRGRIIEALVRDGYRVVLVAAADEPVERVHALGAEFVEWKLSPRSLNPLNEVKAKFALLQIFRRLSPDLVFNFTIKSVIYGTIAAKLAGARSISVITGLGYMFLEENLRSAVGKLLYRSTLRNAREVWFLNKEDAAYFKRADLAPGIKVRILPGEGVDLDRFAVKPLPPMEHGPSFLMIARLLKDKGLYEFIEAARIVKSKYPRAVFRLLGPTYSANAASVTEAEMDELKRSGTIEYLGSVDDVRPAIEQAHCLVLPSYREGMPRVLMEGAAMGRPAVATNVPGCRDVVQDDRTGLLCAPQDAQSLADALIKMIELPAEDWAAMAAGARGVAEAEFDDRKIMELYRDAVTSALSGEAPVSTLPAADDLPPAR